MYLQQSFFGNPEVIRLKPKQKPTQNEIDKYYAEHTLRETVRHFRCRPSKLNISPNLKNGRVRKRLDIETEVQIVFAKTFTKISDLALSKIAGVSNKTIAAVERRNLDLKNLFEEYRTQIGNRYCEHFSQNMDMIMSGMDAMLVEAFSKKTIKKAELKELIDGWSKLHANIMEYVPRDTMSESGDVEAKAQLINAIEEAVKANTMDKAAMEGIYYSPDDNDKDDADETAEV